MIVTIGTQYKQVDISGYKPNYESGVQWQCVGGIWQGFDRGSEADHFSTSITIDGLYSEVHVFRDFILAALKDGSDIYIMCSEGERVFGCEFDYSQPFRCGAFSLENIFVSNTPDGRVLGSWEFVLFPLVDISSKFVFTPASWPTLYPKTIERRNGAKSATEQNEIRNGRTAFANDEPTVTVTYYGDRAAIAQAKRYLQTRRTAAFPLSSPDGIFYFEHGNQTQDAYFSGLVDSGNVDQHSAKSEIVVTYLLAR